MNSDIYEQLAITQIYIYFLPVKSMKFNMSMKYCCILALNKYEMCLSDSKRLLKKSIYHKTDFVLRHQRM